MTLAKRLKALEQAQSDKTRQLLYEISNADTGAVDGVTLADLTDGDLEQFVYSRWSEAAPGRAPTPDEMPNREDMARMSAASLAELYFAKPDTMTPREWQAFYTRLLERGK